MFNMKGTTRLVSTTDSSGKKRKAGGAYAGTVGKKVGVTLTPDQVKRVAEIILEEIKSEIRKETARISGLAGRGKPVQLPRTKRFEESWSYRIRGKSSIEFVSTWPSAESHVQKPKTARDIEQGVNPAAAKPFEMKWLSRPKVPYARMVLSETGEVIVRTTPDPNKGQAFWVHPGFKKYRFLARGIRKGKKKAFEELLEEIVAVGALSTSLI